jgi:hypothetical protein
MGTGLVDLILLLFPQTDKEKLMCSYLEISVDKSMTTNRRERWWRRISSSNEQSIKKKETKFVTSARHCFPVSGPQLPANRARSTLTNSPRGLTDIYIYIYIYISTSAAKFMSMWAKFQRPEMGWNSISGPRQFQLSERILVSKFF